MSAAARPLVTVHGSPTPVVMPAVLLAPIRADLVHFVHTSMAKNHRQPYAVSRKAGHQHSAESWGTGRAVSRIPRVSGSGTHRAGQGAFGNMCRKGRMFAPTKTYRRWHRKINTKQRRYAVASALAASAIPSLVMARGHRIMQMSEIPVVVAGIESLTKTAKAIETLKSIGAYADVEKAMASKQIRTGKGKMRNRRYTLRRGPLIVYDKDEGVSHACRNLPGVDTQQVDRLNLLELAPGGHLGRFIIWSEAAFKRLDDIFGTQKKVSMTRSNWRLPRPMVTNTDISRIINSSEVQAVVRPVKRQKRVWTLKKNPLKNLGAMVKLNPYALTMKRNEIKTAKANRDAKAAGTPKTAAQKKISALKKKKSGVKKMFYQNILLGN